MDVASGSGTIDFLNSGTNGAANTIGAGITMNDPLVIRSNNTLLQTFGGVITDGTGSRSITFNNDVNGTANNAASNQGQIALGVANTYDGGTTISDVRVASGIAGAFGTGAVTISGAGQAYLTGGTHTNTFNLNSSGWVEGAGNLGALRIEGATLSGTINLQRDSQIGVNSGTGTISGSIAGPFNLTKIRGALLVVSGTNTYAGLTTVNDGTLRLGSTGALGNSQTVIVENPGNPGSSDNNTLQLSGGLTFGNGKTLILRNNSTSNISNARTLLENQAGNNTWAGNIVLQSGTNQTLTAASGTTLTISGAVTQAASPSASLFIRGNGNGTINGSLNLGSAQLAKTDGGTWTINSAGNTHGNIIIGNGTLVANNNNALNPTSPITLGEGNANNTTLTINDGFTQALSAVTAASSSSGSHRINGGGALDTGTSSLPVGVADTAATNELTITANLTGSGGITKNGTGNLVLNNTTTGPVVVTGGTLTSSATLGGLSLATGTTLVPGTTTTVGTINTSTLSLTDGTIRVNLGSEGSDLVNVTNPGGLSQTGTTTIEVTPNGGFNPASTFYPVITHSGSFVGTGGFTVGTLPGRLVGTVTNNGTAIGITATNDRIIWTGASGPTYAWDNSAANDWKKSSDGTPTAFLSQDDVIFNNDGIANNLINLSGTINPVRVEFAHTSGTYTLSGGTLSGDGNMPLAVTAGGSVVLKNSNTYTGSTTVTGNSTLEVDHSTGTLTGTSGVTVDTGSTLKLTRDNGADFTFNRNIAGAGTVLVDLNTAGTAGSRSITINGTNSGFNGTWNLDPSGTFSTNGTLRAIINNPNHLGTAPVIARDGGQLWFGSGITIPNNLTLTGAGFQETAGGTPATSATGADGSSPTVPALAYGGIGAVRMENNGVLSGSITLNGTTKVMPYNATGTISGNITNTNSTDDFVFGGGTAGSNLFLTGENSALERIWVNGGGTTGTNQLLIGNNTTTGTLGSGDVILYQDAAAATLRFQRSDGYTLGAGQKIIAAHNGTATNLANARVIVNTPGAGVTLNGGTIDLSDGTNGGQLYVGGFVGGNGVNGSILNIDSGSTVQAERLFAGDQTGISGTVNMTGGSVSVINQVRFGHYGSNTSVFNLSGGNLTITATPPSEPSSVSNGEQNGTLYLGIDGTGVMNHSGGTLNVPAVVLDNRGATGGTDQYNLSGSGILELRNSYGLVGRNTDAVVSLGGGTIRNTGSAGTDVSINATTITASGTTSLDTTDPANKFSLMASIGGSGTLTTSGGGVIELEPDSNTTKTSVSSGSGTQTISAILAGSSAFSKVGSGTTTLSAANTYSGATTVSAGRLNLTGSLANSDLTVANGASLGGEGSAKTLTFGATGTDTSSLFTNANTTGAMSSTGTLTVNGSVNVTLSGGAETGDTITVLNHGGTTAAPANFALADASSYRGSTFNVTGDSVTGGSVTVDIDSLDLTWKGTTASWEIAGTEGDWNTDDEFFQGDRTTFPDLASASQTIAMSGLLQPAKVTFSNTAATSYTLTGTTGNGITGPTSIAKTGVGTVTLGGDNSFTGGITVGAGTLIVGSDKALGATDSIINVNDGGQINYSGVNIDVNRSYSLFVRGSGPDGTGAIRNDTASIASNSRITNLTLTEDTTVGAYGGTLPQGNRIDVGLNGTINGGGFTLTKVGDAMFNARGAASNISYVVSAGTLRGENNDLALGSTGVTVNPAATLDSWGDRTFNVPVTLKSNALMTSSSGTCTWPGGITLEGDATFGGDGTIAVTTPFIETGSGIITRSGNGVLTLAAANTFSRKFVVSGGTGILRIASDSALGVVPGSPLADAISLSGGGRIQGGNTSGGVDLTLDSNRGIALPSGDGGFHPWNGFTINYGGAITGTGNLTKTDSGILNFTGTAGHSGATSINGGITNLNGATISSTSILQVGTATLNIGDSTAITTGRYVTSQGSGTASVINQTGGTVNITGTDNTNSTAASFLLGHWGTGSSTNYNMSGGTINSAGAVMSLGWDSPSTMFNQSGGTANLLGINIGNTRNNLAIYNLSGGRLNLGASGITTNTNKLINLGGGTLGAFADWTTSQAMTLTGNGGNLTVNTFDSVDNSTPRLITMSGVLSGPGGIVKTGAGTLTLNGANTLNGNFTVNGGTLRIGGGNARNVPTITVNAGAVFETASTNIFVVDHGAAVAASRKVIVNGGTWTMESGDYRIGNVDLANGATWTSLPNTDWGILLANNSGGASTVNVSGTGASVMNGAGALRLQGVQNFAVADVTGSTAADLTVSLALRGSGNSGGAAGGVNKTGDGTMELAAGSSHDYDGATTVSQGTLVVNGSLTVSGTTVNSGATLNGTGSIAGASTVSGTLAPGNSVGTLSFGSTLGLNAGSTYQVEITGASTNDKVAVTGALTANGTITVILDGYTPVAGNSFDIADALSITGSPTFNFAAAPLTAGLVWDTSQFLTTGTISVVPDDPYGDWASTNGITGGKFGDHDGDGVLNLLEFATNSDADDASAGANVYAKMHVLGGENILTLTVAARKNAVFADGVPDAVKQQATKDKVKYTVEASNDLATWNVVDVSELNPTDSAAVRAAFSPALPSLEADWEWHTFRTDGHTAIDPGDFIRLNVEEAP